MKLTEMGLAQVVDLDQNTFEDMTKVLNAGDVANMTTVLELTYHQLAQRKDGVIDLVTTGKRKKDDPEVKSALEGLYAEMTKIELKVTHLKTRSKELTAQWKTTVETPVDTSV